MFRLLEKRTATAVMQVKFFKTFYSFSLEENEETIVATTFYSKRGITREECIERFLKDGFKEKELK